MSQIPRGSDDLFCPFWKGKMSKHCHKCPMWQQFRGTDSNSGKEVDEWRCGLAMIPRLQIETSLHVRQTSAATESFRNEVVKRADEARNGAPALPEYNIPMIEAD